MTLTADVRAAHRRDGTSSACSATAQPRWVTSCAARAAGGDRRAVPVGARLAGLGQQLLRGRRAGRHAGLEGVAFRIAGLWQRHHGGQAARGAVGDGVVRQALRLQRVHDAAAAGADGRRRRRPAVRGRAAVQRSRRGPDRGAVLALTPVAALMFRYNNPDALLVLLLVGRRVLRGAGHRDGEHSLDRVGGLRHRASRF